MNNAIVLAGGKNSRMKETKAFSEINGRPVIDIIINKLKRLFSEIIVVTNDNSGYENYDVKLVEDVVRDKGPLAGLYSGLMAGGEQFSFVVGCDMPFINTELVRHMMVNTSGCDVVVPMKGALVEPLHGFYSKRCLPFMRKQLDRNNTGIKSFYGQVRVKYITENEVRRFDRDMVSFFNINTAEDLKKARSMGIQHE